MPLKDYPQWVLNHKTKGTEIRFLNNRYYLYRVHCEYVNGKNKKITDEYLGIITSEGIIPPKRKIIIPVVKEYGLFILVFTYCQDIIKSVSRRYPSRYQKLLPLAICKVFYNNNISDFNASYFSELYPRVEINLKKTQSFLRLTVFHP